MLPSFTILLQIILEDSTNKQKTSRVSALLVLQFLLHHSFYETNLKWCRSHLELVGHGALRCELTPADSPVEQWPSYPLLYRSHSPRGPLCQIHEEHSPWICQTVLSAITPSCLDEHALRPVATWELLSYGGHSFYYLLYLTSIFNMKMGDMLLLCSCTAAVVALKASLTQSDILLESCFPRKRKYIHHINVSTF